MSSDHEITSKLQQISMEESTFDLKSYLKANIISINRALDKAVPLRQPEKLYEAMRYSVLGEGKRVRALLCLAACSLVGGDESVAMPAACALEMIHSMSLIQDDLPIMDNDDFRRGKPTTHKVFGTVVSLLAAGSLAALSIEHLATAATDIVVVDDEHGEESTQVSRRTKISPEKILEAIAELASSCGGQGVAAGQLADMDLAGIEDVGVEDLKFIHIHKTAKLIEAAVVMGALLGGATTAEVEIVRLFGRKIGLLFQVVDDILDITRSSDELGKSAGKDLVADKITFPKLLGLNESKEYALKLNVEAKDLLLGFDSYKAKPLVALADFIAYRQR